MPKVSDAVVGDGGLTRLSTEPLLDLDRVRLQDLTLQRDEDDGGVDENHFTTVFPTTVPPSESQTIELAT